MRLQDQGMTACPTSFPLLDQTVKSALTPVKRDSKQLNIETPNHRFSTMSNKDASDASEIQEKQKQPDMMSWSSFKIYLQLITTGQAQAPFRINPVYVLIAGQRNMVKGSHRSLIPCMSLKPGINAAFQGTCSGEMAGVYFKAAQSGGCWHGVTLGSSE